MNTSRNHTQKFNITDREHRLMNWIGHLYSTSSFWEYIFAIIILVVIVFYSFMSMVTTPFVGYTYSSDRVVNDIYVPQSSTPQLQVGDRVDKIDQIDITITDNYITPYSFENHDIGDVIELGIMREGQPITILWVIPGPNVGEIIDHLFQISLSFAFWVVGVLTALLIRPKNTHSRLLVAFNYVTAIWLAAGHSTSIFVPTSLFVFRAALWLSVPIYIHLHWVFPRQLNPYPRKILSSLYGFALLMILAELLSFLPRYASVAGLMTAVIGCMLLLVVHWIQQKEERRTISFLAFVFLIAIIPTMITGIMLLTNNPPAHPGRATFTLILVPIAYFFVTARNQPGGLRIRSNSTISYIIYGVIIFTIFIPLVLFPTNSIPRSSYLVVLALITLVLISLASISIFPRFHKFVDRYFFGVHHPSESMIVHATSRITMSLDIEQLTAIFHDEIFPSLFIKEAAIIKTNGSTTTSEIGQSDILLLFGLTENEIPTNGSLDYLSNYDLIDGYIIPHRDVDDSRWSWVKVVLPLKVEDRKIGVCLLGHRDPDDYYSDIDLQTLKTVMNQTALAIVNIDKTRELHILYQNDIEREENERSYLARELHDNVLGKLAILAYTSESMSKDQDFTNALESSVRDIRTIIHHLRPSLLSYGLIPALNELADELTPGDITSGSTPSIIVQVNPSQSRFPDDVELHIFRIVQEACYNAITHASPQNITIYGEVEENNIDLSVSDDGVGFRTDGNIDLTLLLSNGHYGLVGMFERATLIGANITVKTQVGEGTSIRVTWIRPNQNVTPMDHQ